MRTTRFLIATVAALGVACGDNHFNSDGGNQPACSDGIDNDADGMTDFPEDVGCTDTADDTEDSGAEAQCSDGRDNDGDGKTDYPNDPGCLVPQQDSETDDCPEGATCAQCSNGIDDDGNGAIDYPDDIGCESAADRFEFASNPNACGSGLTIKQLPADGMDSGMLDGTTGFSTIVSPCGGGGNAPAIVYQLSLTEPKVLVASTDGSAIDTVIDIRGSNCLDAASEIACSDDIDADNTGSSLTRSLPAGNYYLIVEGHDSSETGAYELDVDLFAGEGASCTTTSQCGPELVCRMPLGTTQMICTKPACSDTIDDDADGKNGYPADPGCASPTDNDETDDCPSGPNCPACSNGTDDDGDSLTDYPADTSCSAAGGSSESCNGEDDPILAIGSGTTTGTLAGTTDDHAPSCGGDAGVDRLYTLTLPAMRSLTIDSESSSVDTILSLLSATCQEPSVACDDDGGTSDGASLLTLSNLAASTYIVAVDAYNAAEPGAPYALHVAGVIAPGGSCDPARTLGGALTCPAGNPCEGAPGTMKCRPSACGDGINNNDGDTLIDFPLDPGCTSIDDTDESDTCPGVGPGCPECADGADNDGDGMIDFPLDPNCTSLATESESCITTDGVRSLTMPVTSDTTTGANDDLMPSCGSTNNTAPDHTYRLQLPALTTLSIVNENNYDAVIALYNSTCGGTALQCRDTPEDIVLTNVAAGTYYYVTDGYSSAGGPYTLTVSGTIANGQSCEAPLAQSGALTCGTGYACKGTAGSRTCQRAQCNDGMNNDADAVADFPNDPGCTSISDDDETDDCPSGPMCPVCSDGQDNDMDSLIDYPNDTSCVSASGTSEACLSADGITPLILPMTMGTTVGATNDSTPSCGSSTNTAPDRIYSLSVPALSSLTIANTNSFDAAVALFDATCGGTALTCTDEPETITRTDVAAGTYYYLVDGYSSGSGAYTIAISGTIVNGQSCEGMLATSGALTCGPGYACSGTAGSRTCQVAPCGDGIDNDSDGVTDYPADPGCASSSDTDETNPAIAAVCSNGMDDDNDTTMDWPGDYGCSAASGTSEAFCAAEVDATSLITTTPVTGTTAGKANNFPSTTCQSTATGPDVAYALTLPVPVQSLVLDLSASSFDTVLTMRDPQCTSQLACDDDSGSGSRSMITRDAVDAGTYAIVIDGYSSGSGTYSLSVRGTVAAGTACTSPLFAAGVLACRMGTSCTSGTCQ